MAETSGLVVTSQYQMEATKWLQALKRRESASVIFFPRSDRLRRYQQFLEDKLFIKSVLGEERYFFKVLDFDVFAVEEKKEFLFHVAEQLNFAQITPKKMDFTEWISYLREHKITLVLVIPQAEQYLTEENIRVLSFLTEITEIFDPSIIVLSFFEADITNESITHRLSVSTCLYQNVYYYPLYSETDTRTFLTYLEKKWDKPISADMKQKIIDKCGGHFWLVKEAARQFVSGHVNPFILEGMQFRVRAIYDQFTVSEKSLLTKLMSQKKTLEQSEQQSLTYFRQMNFIDDHKNCTVGLYKDFVFTNAQANVDFVLRDGKFFLNQVPVDRVFSNKERRALKIFLENKWRIISRDEIASALWPTDTEKYYSDWAIDQIIARIRKRFSELALPPTLLRAVRGKGYLLDLPSV